MDLSQSHFGRGRRGIILHSGRAKASSLFVAAAVAGFLLAEALARTIQAASVQADAVVLVNSQSARYLDFQHFIQPYLDNFGFPYTVQDIATNIPSQSISNYAVIIIGHSQLDTNLAYLSETVQTNLSLAVANGTGLVNFDNDLDSGSGPRYQFVQDIFGFSYGSGASGSGVSLPPTEPSSQMHYITALHPTNDVVPFRPSSSLTLPGITVPATATALASVGGQPLVVVSKYGQGRAVQWGSYGWMVSTVLGPVDGLDDVLWRGVVWAARKPFVMRGLPNFVTMRIDDAYGPFGWVHAANAAGFKPFVALFISNVVETSAADLRTLISDGQATAGIHSFDTANTFFYFNHQAGQAWPDNVQSNNFYIGTQWLTNHGITLSKICATHYSEIGVNAFAGLKAWGVEYVPIEVVPGTVEYATPGAPWVVNGPYRLYEVPQPGQVNWPTYYADWLTVPGHPEFDGQFFNIYSEVRDLASCGEWCPDNNVAGSISRATQMAKRALDSMVMATIFSHEGSISPISTANWQAILQGITNSLASHDPTYVTLDYASQYVRATRTSRLVSSAFDPGSGQVTATFSGKTDLDTGVYVFVGADNAITSTFGNVPAFPMSLTNQSVEAGPLRIINAPASRTNDAVTTAVFTVGAAGTWPLGYRWYRNETNVLTNGGQVSGADSPTLTISNLLGGDAGSYRVVITNAAGSLTSAPPAVLTVLDPAIISQPVSQNSVIGGTAAFSVGTAGTASSYQWLKNGEAISGATGTTLNLTNVNDGDAGSYSVAVSNVYMRVVSSNATLAVFHAPAANDDSYGATAGTTLAVAAPGVLGNDTVTGWNNLTARLVTGPIHGTLNLNTSGGFTYTPLTNHVGPDSFTYQAVNGPTNSGVATVTIATAATGIWFADGFSRLTDPGPLSPWVVQSGNWAVTGGAFKAETSALLNYGYAYLTNSWTNYSVEGRIQFSTPNAWGGGLGGRLNPATGAHYAAWVYPEGSPGGSNVLRLIKFQSWTSFGYSGSIGAAMAEASLAAVGTNWHSLKLAFRENQIAVFYDGNQVLSVPDVEAVPYGSGGISADVWTYLLPYTMSVGDVVVRPLVADDSYSVTRNRTLTVPAPGVLGNDTGVYATNLVAVLLSGPTNGTLKLSTYGGLVYSPATNFYGTDSFSYQANQGSTSLGAATVTITVMPDVPVIIQAPTSRTNNAGTTTVFNAAALGTLPLSYQWFWNETNRLDDAGKVSGAHSATLTISNVLGGDAGSYVVVVSNAYGSVTSAPPAVLTVIDPVIIGQPVSQNSVAGATAAFSVATAGTAPSYQWLKNGVAISGATGTTLNLPNVNDGDAGSYSVAVSNVYGSIISSSATLVVFYPAPAANDDSYGATAGTTLAVAAPGVLGNDTVTGWNNLTARLVTGPIHGTLNLNTSGGFTYTPLTNHVGPDSFTYQAVNGPTNSGVATVTIATAATGIWFADGFSRLTDPGPLSPWVVQSGNWAVTGGAFKAETSALLNYGYAYLTNSWTNYSVEGRIQFSTPNAWGGGLGGRLNPATGAHYAAWVYPEGSPGGSNVLRLIKFQSWTSFGYSGSIGAAMAEASLAAVGTNWHSLKLAFRENQIAVFYDGNQVLSVPDVEAVPYGSGGISADVWTYLLPYTMSVGDVVVRPLVADDSYSVTRNRTLTVPAPGVLGNDTGVYATNLVAVLLSGPTNGTLDLSTNGELTYSPATNFYGTDSFSYQANQGSTSLGTATVTITVMPDVPVIIQAPRSRTNYVGTTTVFNAAALGTLPLSYQWFWNETNRLDDAGKVSGAHSATLTISNVLGGDAGSYVVVVSNAVGSVTSAPPALLTVIDPVVVSPPVSRTNNAGTAATFSAVVLGSLPLSYQWFWNGTNGLEDAGRVSGAHSASLTISNVLGGEAGSYTLVVTNALGSVTSSPPAVLTVIDPVIVSPPVSRTNNAGTAATFSTVASGTNLRYQWFKNGAPINGATNATLTLAAVFAGDMGGYSVVVSNAYGSVTSSPPALLTVIDPVITSQPVDQTNAAGTTARFSVGASGTSLRYQWFKNGAPINGATNATLTLAAVFAGDRGGYSVVVSNAYGSVTSSPPALLTVIDPFVVSPPVSRTNNAGTTATFSAVVLGSLPLSYQWFWNGTNGLGDAGKVSGAHSATLTISNVLGGEAGSYTLVVTNALGSVISSPPAVLTVIDPVITSQPVDQTNAAGTTARFSVGASGTSLRYQWFKGAVAINGATNATLTLAAVFAGDRGGYSVMVSNAYGSVTSSPPAVLTVIDPVIVSPPVSRTNNAGTAATFSTVASGTNLRYQWFKGGVPINGASNATLTLAAVFAGDMGGYSVVVSNAYGSVTSSPPALLTVIDPFVVSPPVSRTNNAGTAATFSAVALGTLPLSYQWFWNGTNGLGDAGRVSGAHSATLTISNVLGGEAGSYTLVVTNALGSVISSPPAVLTVIDPVITSQPVDQTNAAGTTARFSVGVSGTSPGYQWFKGGGGDQRGD